MPRDIVIAQVVGEDLNLKTENATNTHATYKYDIVPGGKCTLNQVQKNKHSLSGSRRDPT